MKPITTITLTAFGGAILITLAAICVAKAQTPNSPVQDSYFEPTSENLEHVPAGLATVEPTHFPDAPGKIKHVHEGDNLTRIVGQNVTFRDLMAEAYACSPGHVMLPANAPKGRYDFVVTISPQTRKHLRTTIETKLGYAATVETLPAEVLVLQVKDPSTPGLTVSTASDDDINFHDGQLYFTRQPLSVVTRGLEEGLGRPVLDQTGLTNNYDFTVPWTTNSMQAMQAGAFHLDGVQKFMNGWGLDLTTTTTNVELCVVQKVR